jgi:hypothetical protein
MAYTPSNANRPTPPASAYAPGAYQQWLAGSTPAAQAAAAPSVWPSLGGLSPTSIAGQALLAKQQGQTATGGYSVPSTYSAVQNPTIIPGTIRSASGATTLLNPGYATAAKSLGLGNMLTPQAPGQAATAGTTAAPSSATPQARLLQVLQNPAVLNALLKLFGGNTAT